MTLPFQQKALLLMEHAGEYKVDIVDVIKPDAGEVVVRVDAAALNPTDWRTRYTEYSFAITEYPTRQGSDASGVIVALGEGVTSLNVGDQVIHLGFYSNKLAAFQEYTVVSADLVPANLTLDQAATIPLALSTSAIIFYGNRIAPELGGGAGFTPFWQEGGRDKLGARYSSSAGLLPSVNMASISRLECHGARLLSTGSQAFNSPGCPAFPPTASSSNIELATSLGTTHIIDRNLSFSALAAAAKAITSEPLT
ncbi:hypothetical protein EIP91_008775 [Steccherinum ochraceum]|uniref:Enoyl reductase (ER) domain-containing protein n=1 Tax=Steccherinum ochraceum TaxID=92696 RepID=A0A4R0RFR9_9APHY|nr:hypothetical protein EIP91_008775 [Steccherinum ochraceum]